MTPDNFIIRLLVYVAGAGLAAGCGVESFAGGGRGVATWLIAGSLCAGVMFALLHLLEILTRRLQTRLSELLGLLFVYALTLVLVSSGPSLIWDGGANAATRSLTIVPFSAVLLVLLLRSTVLARCAVPFLPPGFAKRIVIRRSRGVLLSDEICVPARWVYGLYWISPLAWWGLVYSLIAIRKLTQASPVLYVVLVLVSSALAARTLMGLAAYRTAFRRHREAVADGDDARAAETRWYLGSNGLLAGGIVAFYAFSLLCLRVQDEALAASMRLDGARIVAQLRKWQPPHAEAGANAEPHYAAAKLPLPISNAEIFLDRWNTPEAALFLRNARPALNEVKAAAALERDEIVPDYAAIDLRITSKLTFNNRRVLVWTLMLEARFAAEDEKWQVVFDNTRTALNMARHYREQPCAAVTDEGSFIEHSALLGLLTALEWSDGPPPDDATLLEAQKLVRDFADRRESALIRTARIEGLVQLREFGAACAHAAHTWPGDVSLKGLIECRPLIRGVGQRQLQEFTETVLPDFQSGFIEVQRDELVSRSRAYGDCQGLSPLPMKMCHRTRLELETLCDYRFAEMALGLARFKLKNGHWPDALQECVPEFLPYVPKDTFKPDEELKYAQKPARIYSLGQASGYHPEQHGDYPWDVEVLHNDTLECVNHVLFLGKPPKGEMPLNVLPGAELEGDAAALKSANAAERRDALHRLALIGKKAAPAAEALVPLLSDPDREQRLYAAYILGHIGHAGDVALDALRAAQWTDDVELRVFVKQALRALK